MCWISQEIIYGLDYKWVFSFVCNEVSFCSLWPIHFLICFGFHDAQLDKFMERMLHIQAGGGVIICQQSGNIVFPKLNIAITMDNAALASIDFDDPLKLQGHQ